WVHVQLHQQKGMISLSPPTICNSAHERILNSLFNKAKKTQAERLQQTGRLIQLKLKQYIDIGQALSEARLC
ncbi:hypothetical protein ACP0FW_26265, partial [Escherichia coli]|uniref:hypothetical protein n=1 Tax=Escherichia coli TaxID=562 RepID=UPI003CE67A3F